VTNEICVAGTVSVYQYNMCVGLLTALGMYTVAEFVKSTTLLYIAILLEALPMNNGCDSFAGLGKGLSIAGERNITYDYYQYIQVPCKE